jgi:hypothetical protein
MNVKELKQGYFAFGNKGAVWSDKVHIYKSINGNLCGNPVSFLYSSIIKIKNTY